MRVDLSFQVKLWTTARERGFCDMHRDNNTNHHIKQLSVPFWFQILWVLVVEQGIRRCVCGWHTTTQRNPGNTQGMFPHPRKLNLLRLCILYNCLTYQINFPCIFIDWPIGAFVIVAWHVLCFWGINISFFVSLELVTFLLLLKKMWMCPLIQLVRLYTS